MADFLSGWVLADEQRNQAARLRMAQQAQQLNQLGGLLALQDALETRPLRNQLLRSQVNQSEQDAALLRAWMQSRGLVPGGAPQAPGAPLAFGAGGVSLPGGAQGNVNTGEVRPAAMAAPTPAPGNGLPLDVQIGLLHPRLAPLAKVEAEQYKPTDKMREAIALGMRPGSPEFNAFVGTQFNQGGAWQVGSGGQINLAPGYAGGRGAVERAEQMERARFAPFLGQTDANNRPIAQTQLQFVEGVGGLPQAQQPPTLPPTSGYSPQEQQAIDLVRSGQATSARPTATGAEVVRPAPMAAPPAAPRGMGLTPGERATQESIGREQSQVLFRQYDALQNVPDSIMALNAARDAAANAGPFTGSFAETKLDIAKFFNNNFGTNINPDAVANAEQLRSALFRSIMDNLKKLDAQPSQLQQKVMMDSLGQIGTDPAAIPKILDLTEDILRSRVEQHNQRVSQARERGGSFLYDINITLPERRTTQQITDAGRSQPTQQQGWGIRRIR